MSMPFHSTDTINSWSRVGQRSHQVARPRFIKDLEQWAIHDRAPRLAIGSRRSYSDVCLADRGRILDMTGLDRFRSFDPESGLLVAEAGVTIAEVLNAFVPMGFFIPVTPGTKFVTLGGAVANDVHGKNHHRAGTFGHHVKSLVLLRSDGSRIEASPSNAKDLFAATIGGLGLTGIITAVTIQLQRIPSSQFDVETRACPNLETLCDGLDVSSGGFEHNVAWIDCSARGERLGRGLLTCANWSEQGGFVAHRASAKSMPTDRLNGLINPITLRLFNNCYFALGRLRSGRSVMHYEPFLYPLDSILHWNRLYGRKGFFQYQCVIPDAAGREPLRALLQQIAASGEGSFLAVLKRFGAMQSPGMLSFPQPGLTLALDFRNRGSHTLQLLRRLDAIVTEAGGRLYPAKDLRMPREIFVGGYPEHVRFAPFIDPACQSDFRKRMFS
jgi:L-gulonolactone oxidase